MSVKTQRSPTHVPPVIHRYGLQSTTLASVAAGPDSPLLYAAAVEHHRQGKRAAHRRWHPPQAAAG